MHDIHFEVSYKVHERTCVQSTRIDDSFRDHFRITDERTGISISGIL